MLKNCKVKEGRYSGEMSSKKFKLDAHESCPEVVNSLEEVVTLSANQQVSIVGKAVKVGDETEITSKLGKKLNCILYDSAAQIQMVLWESNVGKLIEGVSSESDD